jgi:phosphoribosylaminoimidazole (AIR) synthetase
MDTIPAGWNTTILDALLVPHRNYLPILDRLLEGDVVKALVHVTGGGLVENVPRVLPEGCSATIRLGTWPLPPLFQLVREVSALDAEELHRTLNMGVGMVVVVAAADVERARREIDEETWVIGEITQGERGVRLE